MSIFFDEQYNSNQSVDEGVEHNADNIAANEHGIERAIAEWKQKYAYLSADFENFKRRSMKEYEAMRVDVYARICKPLLTIVDDFERACAAAEQQKIDIEGFKLIRKALEKVLTDAGIVEMQVDNFFDPEKHEALLQVQSADHQTGQIVSVLQKGYLLHGVVLRAAKVSVAQ